MCKWPFFTYPRKRPDQASNTVLVGHNEMRSESSWLRKRGLPTFFLLTAKNRSFRYFLSQVIPPKVNSRNLTVYRSCLAKSALRFSEYLKFGKDGKQKTAHWQSSAIHSVCTNWKLKSIQVCDSGCVSTSTESNGQRSSLVVLQFGDNPLVPLWCSTRGWSWTPWFGQRQLSGLRPLLEFRYKFSRPERDVTAVESQQGSSLLLKSRWRLPEIERNPTVSKILVSWLTMSFRV